MAIGSAVQKGSSVYVYNERGGCLFIKNGTLIGYTGSTVTVKNGGTATTYNEKGGSISSTSCS